MYLERAKEARIDRYAGPYERWVLSPELGRPYAFPAVRRPSPIMAAILDGSGDPHLMGDAEVRVPPLWSSQGGPYPAVPFAFRDLGGAHDITDLTLAQRLDTLSKDGGAARIRLNLPVPEATWPAAYKPDDQPDGWRAPAQPPVTVIGVIDDGLPFANRAFLGNDKRTRISHLWLQSARAKNVDRVPFGKEIVNAEIDALRAQYGADERSLYRAAGAIDRDIPEIGTVLDGRASHGAHILGLAAGNGAFIDGPELDHRIQIVAVQLPNTVAWDTSGFGKEMFMLSALHYIFCRADEIAQGTGADSALPLIVNFSYGWNAGRHDGASVMESVMEEMLTRRRAKQPATAIVLPMGNHFDADMHAQITASDFENGPARIGWMLPPDDHTSSYLEIWLPEGLDTADWQVRMIPPPGTVLSAGDRIEITADDALDPVGDPRRFVEMEIDGRNVGQISVDFDRGSRWRVLVATIPTAETGTGRRIPCGQWTVEIDPRGGRPLAEDQAVDLWVQRDDDPRPMGTRGRQSRLIGPQVTGYGAMSAIASPPSATRVAGVVGASFEPARYSGAGIVRDRDTTPRIDGAIPTLSATSDQSRAIQGVRSIGCMTGSFARVTGTSAAAARTTRWMAGNAAAGQNLDHGLVNDTATQETAGNPILHRARIGNGRVPL